MLTFNGAGQGSLFAPDTWCGRMCLEPSPQTKERISGLSSRKQSVSQNRTLPTFHYLQKGGGRWLTPGMGMDGPLPTEFSTHSFGEYPSAVVGSRLSQILEAAPPSKYFLSAKACAGILRRAKRRGRELPPELKLALEMQEIKLAEQFFNNCPPELFETANIKLMALERELGILYKEMRGGSDG